MKTFILAAVLAFTAVSGAAITVQPAAANTPVRTPERVDRPMPRPSLASNPNLIVRECLPCRVKDQNRRQ